MYLHIRGQASLKTVTLITYILLVPGVRKSIRKGGTAGEKFSF